VTAWPLVVADSEGFFADEGIEVDKIFTFDGGQLLAGGQIDVLNDGADSGLLAAEQGKDAIAFAPLASRVTDGLIVRDDVAGVASLAGTTLRTSGAGATDEFLLKRYLSDNGVDPDEVEYLPVEDDGAALAQLDADQIDGGLFDQGLLLEVERGDIAGAKVLVEPADLGVYPWNALQTTRTFAEANEDKVVGFVRAMMKAIEFIRDPANKDAVVDAVVASDESLDRADIVDTYDAAKGFGLYATEALTPADIQPAVDFLESGQEEPMTVKLDEFIDNTYFERAQGDG
jgi:NitT/TauT family transport system substrate-binding protein